MSDDGDEYCVAHDRRIILCADPARCREVMTGWGLYQAVAADELTALTEELGLYG